MVGIVYVKPVEIRKEEEINMATARRLVCDKCGGLLAEKEFYSTYRLDKYPTGKLNTCKKCITMHVDNWDPETYVWILEECDVPYLQEKWNSILKRWVDNHDPTQITGVSILGKYLSSMKIKPWGEYRWKDNERLQAEEARKRLSGLKAQGYTDEEIQEKLEQPIPPKPKEILQSQEAVDAPEYYSPEEVEDEYSQQLTEEDKRMLRLKWGKGYTAEEWVRLEQMFADFNNSYDIQTAGHKDTLIMVCKASLKANQLLDAGDLDGAQKMTKVYNDLMKSGNFQGVQNKSNNGEGIDAVGTLALICEKQGFIPRYYVDSPKDKVDQTILDQQHFTRTLVMEELNLGNMIESALLQIEKDKEKEAKIDTGEDTDEDEDKDLFTYREDNPITDEDYLELAESDEKLREQDRKALSGG